MTQRARRAIIEFWLWRHSFRTTAAIFVVLCLTTTGFAAEAKKPAGKVSTLVNKLVSRESKVLTPAEQKVADEKKKKTALLDPSEEDEKALGTMEKVTGEVGAHNNFGVAVVLNTDPVTHAEQEAWFNFTSKMKLSGFRSIKDLQDGDKVAVSFKQTVTGKRILKGLALVAKKPKEPTPPAPSLEAVL